MMYNSTMKKLKKDEMLKLILETANHTQTLFVIFGLMGMVLILMGCDILGYLCTALFALFAWLRFGLEGHYRYVEKNYREEP